ncbi:uncharacterized protein EV420DRAFT_1748967 [Desarmillaria tabescens]|uniref:F-box domain-containing protein n=1 Tax=Armillaria tabescens TaxID=1929756 RepID=A0AA39N3Z0_ARMTA|nr:uncharacterized protein EV420DRAFT_1748967 [Desarmillaria tabescens]KAK0457082.1 hypothetical protein EV420DRAFT_1748967 [Desarmillaria tabescens]
MSEIPTEIMEQIIDELSDDREALVASLSVSRAFHSRARYHLFQTVRLETESDFNQFNSLCDISPVISSLVQSLKIFSRSTVPQLPSLPNVTSLHIRGHLDDVWQTNFLSTTVLMFEDIVFSTAMSFRTWICAYSHLTSLSLISVIIHHPAVVGAYALAQGPPLEFLSIAYVNYSVYKAFLGSTSKAISRFALHGLRKIQHKTVFAYDAAGIHKILAVTCSTIQELDMRVHVFDPRPLFNEVLDISQVPTVNYRVSGVSKIPFTNNIRWLSYCTDENDRPASMERLVIHLDLPGFLDRLTFTECLEPLDAILTDPRYCMLKVVQFILGGKERRLEHGLQAYRDDISMALPKLHAAGRLVVEDEAA